jgi:hypothetical protein
MRTRYRGKYRKLAVTTGGDQAGETGRAFRPRSTSFSIKYDASNTSEFWSRDAADGWIAGVAASGACVISGVEGEMADIPASTVGKLMNPSKRYSLMFDLKMEVLIWTFRWRNAQVERKVMRAARMMIDSQAYASVAFPSLVFGKDEE